MTTILLHLADIGLILFHSALVLFNCTGWAWRRTRRLHLLALALTALSWFLLGLWFGQGYCVCTDLHWRVRAALGEPVQDTTYIQFLVRELTGWRPEAGLVTTLTGTVFAVSVVLSVSLNLRDTVLLRRALKEPQIAQNCAEGTGNTY